MYTYRDTTDHSTLATPLPAEAVSINGSFIENLIPGYRTLYTKGREGLEAELETYSVGTADGEKVKYKRYPSRTLTVGFQLVADSDADFRDKFNRLNNILSIDEADFIFNDEPAMYFSGTPIANISVDEGQNIVKGEWKIYCAYPYKRSVNPITVTNADAVATTNTSASFEIEYTGGMPSRPLLRATFAGAKSGGDSSEDGDCGFIAFMDANENIIQLGNPDVLDLDAYAEAETLINREFTTISDWSTSGGHVYDGKSVTGSVTVGNITDTYWQGGDGQTQSYARPSYGTGTGMHGSILHKLTTGAVNFELDMVHRLCVQNAIETGCFECGVWNGTRLVAGFVIEKLGNGTTGTVRYIVDDTEVGTDNIDLSYYNTHFGYCKREPVYVTQSYKVKVKKKKKVKKKTKTVYVWESRTRKVQNGYRYIQSNLCSCITKEGSDIYFDIGNLATRAFKAPALETVVASDVCLYFGTSGTQMNTNAVHSIAFRRTSGAVFAEQPNVFTSGDVVEADCNDATVYLYRAGSIGGHLEPQYGALGNDWEDFLLVPGTNYINVTWSPWVNPSYKPQIEIIYNEVWI